MENKNKYKLLIKWGAWNVETRQNEVIPHREDVSWGELVNIIAERGIGIVDDIKLHVAGQSGGERMLDRAELWELWKAVELHRKNPI